MRTQFFDRTALENEEVDEALVAAGLAGSEDTSIPADEEGNAATDALELDADLERDEKDSETVTSVIDNLEETRSACEALISSGKCTHQTADLIVTGVRQQLARLHMPFHQLAMESVDTDPLERHRLALEGIGNAINRIVQSFVVGFKHSWNAIADFFKSQGEAIKKYEEKLNATKQEFNTKRANMKTGDIDGSLVELWYHFKTGTGQTPDVVKAVEIDLEASNFMLETFPGKINEALKKLVTQFTANSKITDEAGVVKFAKQVETDAHPFDLFDKKYLGGKKLLSVVGLDEDSGSKRTPITYGGETFEKLAHLATNTTVVESGSLGHGATKVIAKGATMIPGPLGTLATVANMAGPDKITFQAADTLKIIEGGLGYVKGIHAYQAHCKEFEQVANTLDDAFEALFKASPFVDQGDASKVIRQIDQYAEALVASFRTPALKEVARAIKSAKYCNYLALRMIHLAT